MYHRLSSCSVIAQKWYSSITCLPDLTYWGDLPTETWSNKKIKVPTSQTNNHKITSQATPLILLSMGTLPRKSWPKNMDFHAPQATTLHPCSGWDHCQSPEILIMQLFLSIALSWAISINTFNQAHHPWKKKRFTTSSTGVKCSQVAESFKGRVSGTTDTTCSASGTNP